MQFAYLRNCGKGNEERGLKGHVFYLIHYEVKQYHRDVPLWSMKIALLARPFKATRLYAGAQNSMHFRLNTMVWNSYIPKEMPMWAVLSSSTKEEEGVVSYNSSTCTSKTFKQSS